MSEKVRPAKGDDKASETELPREVHAARWIASRLLLAADRLAESGHSQALREQHIRWIRAIELAAVHPDARASSVDVDARVRSARFAIFAALEGALKIKNVDERADVADSWLRPALPECIEAIATNREAIERAVEAWAWSSGRPPSQRGEVRGAGKWDRVNDLARVLRCEADDSSTLRRDFDRYSKRKNVRTKSRS